ncbi:MAG: hypothetical protein JWM95_2316 [Gemmatimonadetes bacterium]|nr:hypothetical protein [Gemmatimonadota bacterium]
MVITRLYVLAYASPSEQRRIFALEAENDDLRRQLAEARRRNPDAREILRQMLRGVIMAGVLLVGFAFWWRYSAKGLELQREITLPEQVTEARK